MTLEQIRRDLVALKLAAIRLCNAIDETKHANGHASWLDAINEISDHAATPKQ